MGYLINVAKLIIVCIQYSNTSSNNFNMNSIQQGFRYLSRGFLIGQSIHDIFLLAKFNCRRIHVSIVCIRFIIQIDTIDLVRWMEEAFRFLDFSRFFSYVSLV